MTNAQTQTPVLEIVTFRTAHGTDESAFLEAARGTEALLRDRGSLVRRVLTKADDGTWTDVVELKSMDEALSAAKAVLQEPSFMPFMSMIDPESVAMSHAPIMWRMD